MTEQELRNKVVSTAEKYIGYKESNGSHKKIIDIYNSHKPLAQGYKVTYKDAWCAATVSAISILCGLTDIMPTECSCNRMIALYKKLGRFVEDDSYTPMKGDVLFYDWDDNGIGDNKGQSDHVGIVVSVNGTSIKVIEGNKNNAVEYRTIKLNGKFIRGYGVPNYASKASKTTSVKTNTTVNSNVKVDSAKSFSKSLSGTYKTIAGLNIRSGAGTSKTILTVIPKGGKVTCYGYYTTVKGVKWYYVTYKNAAGTKYLGFVSSKYLSK